MDWQVFLHRSTLLGAAAAAALILVAPALAQPPRPVAAIAAPASPDTAAPPSVACAVTIEQVRFDHPLPRIARRLAAGKPIRIVALGSSSTFGAGASTSAASYPSRLAEELSRRFPGNEITVLNRGVNGDEIAGMLARLDAAVIAEKPNLVLWQLGTNSLLRDRAVAPHGMLLREGLARIRAAGAEVVLIDPQYAPRVLAKPNVDGMVSLIATTAKSENVGVFHRFELMRRWYETEHLPFATFVSADGLHMNDWSYACLAKALSLAIAEAATRPTATATGPQVGR
jgi:lysophospholipase L1-like esterase